MKNNNVESKDSGLDVKGLQTLSNTNRHSVIKNLLESPDGTVDDKVAKVKIAHHVDKEQFQNAFRTLMGKQKS